MEHPEYDNPLVLEEVGGGGDNLRAEVDYEGMVAIQVEEPWAGDTGNGFGRSGSIRLTHVQAGLLMVWLQHVLSEE